MPHPPKPHRNHLRAAGLAILTISLAAAVVASGALAGHGTSKRVVAEHESAALGKTVLTTTAGRTLYSLSVEKNGKFICTGACLTEWHPLVVPPGVRPTGPVKLGTIVRPDNSRRQVTYRGRPLYRFDGDSKAGEANGEGFKDVGTWHAATPPQGAGESTPSPQPSPPPENPYPY